jgi:oligopeptide/dipeptide ABC transporter ATP-binding protein
MEFISVVNLKKYYYVRKGIFSRRVSVVKALDGVSFDVSRGETLGLVGESGCGKSTLGRSIIRLVEPTSGEIYFDGENILRYNGKKIKALRRNMQIIFQDPYSSLNPRLTVGEIIGEGLTIHGIAKGKEKRERVLELLNIVGLNKDSINKYPHEFSGGQRQRIGIARALSLMPKFIVADEPVSSLDLSIQAQIINLLKDLQDRFGLTYLFISHDLRVVRYISNRIAVMYLGKMVELSESEELYENPLHPYTRALLSSVPYPDPDIKRDKIILEGDIPSPISPPSGCYFHPRCKYSKDICKDIEPELKDYGRHLVACHFTKKLPPFISPLYNK